MRIALSPDLCGWYLAGVLHNEGVELAEAQPQPSVEEERPSPSAAGTGGPLQLEGKGALQQHGGASLEAEGADVETGTEDLTLASYQREEPLREGGYSPHSQEWISGRWKCWRRWARQVPLAC